LTNHIPDPEAQAKLRATREWSPRQWQVLEVLLLQLRHADQQRQHWRSLIAQEVLGDPELLSIVRLCGVREMVAFALGAFIGDIKRFADPKKLVKYVGLNPAFDDSGESRWSGGIGGHGNKNLRCLLIAVTETKTCAACSSKELRQSCAVPKRHWRSGARNSWRARARSTWS
jgi:transposase